MSSLRSIALDVIPIGPATSGEVAFDRFRQDPDLLLIPVVDDADRPIGLIDRNAFSLRMGSQYGRALYAARPVGPIMNAEPLIVDADREIDDFTAAVLSARPSDLLRGFVVVEGDGRYCGVGTPLTLLAGSSAEVARQKRFSETVIENIPAMIFVKDVETGRFLLLNRAGEEILGRPREEVIGRDLRELFPSEEARRFAEEDSRAVAGVVQVMEEELARPEGDKRLLHTRKLALPDEAGRPRFVLGVSEDVTERRRAVARVERMAHYDSLTELPNRVLFNQRLGEALAAARRDVDAAAVLCVDLDHFKTVNDTLGHPVGDALLRAVAERLCGCVREGDTVARLGGDEFAVIQRGVQSREAAQRLAGRVVATLAQPFRLEGQEVVSGASVGVALAPEDADAADRLLQRADLALYAAKAQGRGGFTLFEAGMEARVQARRALETDLRRALVEGGLEVHYQPLFDMRADRLSGCEALCRWRHPERGMIAPVEFIGLAEEAGLMSALGDWVLRTAAAEAALWPEHMRVAVNVSPAQFRGPSLVRSVTSALAVSGLDPKRLELEITEGVLLQDNAANVGTLRTLRGMGCRVSLDDFGTGYSSLSYLRAFPFDKIKIDRSFVQDLPGDRGAAAIVRAVMGVADGLEVTVTAEGVETPEQLAYLRREGCHEVQGYLIGRPSPGEALRRDLAERRQTSAHAA